MITSNVDEIAVRLRTKKEKIDAVLEKTANQCGVLCKNASDPMTPYKSGTLMGSIVPEVTQEGPGEWQLWFGSHGAFGEIWVKTGEPYNYAPLQEYYFGMIAGGWFTAKPQFAERLKANNKELNE
jgi:hypothetical protein